MVHLFGGMFQVSTMLEGEKFNLMSILAFNILITSYKPATMLNVLPEFSQYSQQPPVSKRRKQRLRETAF